MGAAEPMPTEPIVGPFPVTPGGLKTVPRGRHVDVAGKPPPDRPYITYVGKSPRFNHLPLTEEDKRRAAELRAAHPDWYTEEEVPDGS